MNSSPALPYSPQEIAKERPAEGPRIVIIGAGFGGLAAARGLAGCAAQVTLVDRQNHHLFQPLLYQVATAAVSPADVAVPIRLLFRGDDNVSVVMDDITGIDSVGCAVLAGNRRYEYDHLILATGSEYGYFGHETWRERTYSLKTLDDALTMREEILLAFERAEIELDPAERRRLMTFVVIGGGPTGVELAGALAELAKSALARDFRHIVPGEAEILLMEAGPELLHGFPKQLTDFARRALERKGVTVRLETPVHDIGDDGIIAGLDAAPIPASMVIWAAGTQVASVGEWLGADTDKRGRIMVAEDLTIPGHKEIFVIGDAACCQPVGERPLPGVAPVAKQQGAFVARLIKARLASETNHAPFRYRDEGMLATIGRGAAVANLRWMILKGWIAWMFWGLVHIYFLIGFRNRLMIFLNWVWAYFTYGLGARLISRPRRRVYSGPPDSRTSSRSKGQDESSG